MRKLLALLAIGMLFFLLPAAAESPPAPLPGYSLRPTQVTIRVYATRSEKANIVGYIQPDHAQEVQVLSINGDWCYISFTSTYGLSFGYVPLAHFDVAAAPTPTPKPETIIEPGSAAWVMNIAEGYRLNLREAPSYLADSLGKYYTGVPVIMTVQVETGVAQVFLANTLLGWMDLHHLTTDPIAFVPETPVVTITNAGGTLRAGPGTTYDRVDWYPQGTAVTVLGVRSDGWYHVQVGENIGYMSATVLSGTFPFGYGMDSDNPTLSNSNTDQSSVLYINTRSTNGQLHLRSAASPTAKSLGLFYTGTPVTVINYSRTGWAYVRIGQTEGYMDADYLTGTQPTQYGDTRIIRNRHATGLNLRSLPSTGGERLDFAPNYSSVIVLGVLSDDWCYVDYNGTLGYMLNNGSLQTK